MVADNQRVTKKMQKTFLKIWSCQKKAVPLHQQFGRTEAKTEESRVLRSVYRSKFFGLYGAIAQLVEQRTENPCVTGSIPVGTTKKAFTIS